MEETQAMIIISIFVLSLVVVLVGVCLIVNRCCRLGGNIVIDDSDKLVNTENGHPGLDNALYHVYNPHIHEGQYPPPVVRMYSAPAQLLHSTMNNNLELTLNRNLVRPGTASMIKNSLKQLETIQIPSPVKKKLPRVETEV